MKHNVVTVNVTGDNDEAVQRILRAIKKDLSGYYNVDTTRFPVVSIDTEVPPGPCMIITWCGHEND